MPRATRCLVPLLALSASLLGQSHVAYADFGRSLLAELGEKEPPAMANMLERHYCRLLLGGFDLRVPNAMIAKGGDPARVAAIAEVLLDLQDRLCDYTMLDAEARKAERDNLAALRKYVAAWRSKPTSTEAPALPETKQPCVLVLAPTRKDFVGLVGWLGLLDKKYEAYWWNDATAQFADLRVQDEGHVQVIALEYAAPDQKGDVRLGFDMNTREKTGLLQHVAQRAALSWCWRWLGDDADQSFVLGLATDLVVDVLGQNNARSGGSDKSHSTEGRNAFIPGAPSRGGSMEMVSADSSWRLSQGQDYFARVLRQAQKAGEHAAKESKDRLGNFLLEAGEKKHLVTAPFLGKVAFEREPVPDEFGDDYLEFHRAYRSAFVHWLQGNGAKGKTASVEKFATLLQRLIAEPASVTFEGLCKEIYGVPLAGKLPETDTLERRFLGWLATNSR